MGLSMRQLFQYLGSGEEDLVSDVFQPTGHHPKSNSREHVGIVALAREESLSIWKSDWVERAATGKDRTPLQHRQRAPMMKRTFICSQSNGCQYCQRVRRACLPLCSVLICPGVGTAQDSLRLPLCSLQWSNHRPNNHIREASNYRLLRTKSTGS